MESTTAELKVLITCLRYYFSTATAAEVVELLRLEIQWSRLVRMAIERGVMPLLYKTLKQLDSELVPKEILTQLHAYHRMNGLKNIAHTKELIEISTRLEAAGIATIAFKGSVLAATCYGNVALRQFNDLDILVRRQDLWRAKDLLLEMGYQPTMSAADERQVHDLHLQISLSQSDEETRMLNRQFDPSPLHSNPEHCVDLHWGIPPRRIANPECAELIWQNLQSIELMGRSITTFSPEATLVAQCLTVAKHSVDRHLKHICDIAQIVRADPDLDWHLAVEIASQLSCQRLFTIGLGLMHRLLHVPLPEFILAQLPRSQHNRAVNDYIIPVGATPPLYPFTTLDRSWDMLFTIGFHLKLLLKKSLLLHELDFQFISLPKELSLLYYLIRPIRLFDTYVLKHRAASDTSEL